MENHPDLGVFVIIGLVLGVFVAIFGAIAQQMKQVNCPQCREKVDKNATKCPHCSSDIPQDSH